MSLIRMSAAKLAANRANAAKSTGPKSAAGKRISARNSLTHGIYSNRFLVSHDVPGDPHAFLAKMGPHFRAWLNDAPHLVLLRLKHLLVQDALLADPFNLKLQHASEFFCHHLMRAERDYYQAFSDPICLLASHHVETFLRNLQPAPLLAASATSPFPLPAFDTHGAPAESHKSKPISPSFQKAAPR